MARLNGWQRLWLVLSGLYAVPIVLFTVDSIRSIPEVAPYSNSTRADIALKAFAEYSWNESLKAQAIATQRELALDRARARLRLEKSQPYQEDTQTNERFMKGLQEKWGGLVDFAKLDTYIEAEHKKEIDQPSSIRLKKMGYGRGGSTGLDRNCAFVKC